MPPPRNQILWSGLLLAIVLPGWGCAPTPGIQISVPMRAAFSDYPSLGVEVVPTAEGAVDIRSRLATLAVVEFRRLDTFESVVDLTVDSRTVDIVMVIDIVKLNRLNLVQQILLIGREWLRVEVTCHDEKARQVLCEFEVTGSSAAGNVLSKGIQQALESIVDIIAIYLNKHR